MTVAAKSSGRVSSPLATGGAGPFFEQHVDAYWLALLLVRGIPPILHDCAMVEVHFQAERLGWNTDDFLVVGENGSGLRRKLLGQVKRNFTVSATDKECKKAIQDFWKDFKNGQNFSQAADRFALVTFRGTNTLLEHFSGLLDCSRAARDAAEFDARLATPGFLIAKAVHYCDEIRTILGDNEKRSVSAAELWPFLRVLHVLSLDLNSSTRQTEAMIKTLLALTAREPDAVGTAEATWNALLREVGEGMPQARSFSHSELPEALRQRHSPIGMPEERALRALSDHSTLILGGIRATIGNDLHLVRGLLVQQVIENLESAQVVLVTGVAGSGKSGIAKDAIGILAADHFTFSFRAEEFGCPHFDETLQRNQVPANATMLGAILAGQSRKVLLVESVERLLEASTRDAFADLLTLVSRDKSWRVILTCREYSTDLVRACFLESARAGHAVVTVPHLDDGELQEVETVYPTMARPLANATLRRLLRNPYVLDKALQIPWSEKRSLPQSEREFRAFFWQEVVRVDHRPTGGMPRRREAAFMQIALRRSRSLTLYANCSDLDAETIAGLQRDSLIVLSRESKILVAPAHDVLEDWAILQWIDEQYVTQQGSAGKLAIALGTYPAVRRTYRKWVSELVERDPETGDRLFQSVVDETGLPAQFRDDTLVSLLRSPSSPEFLQRHYAALFVNDKHLLRRVIHLLRVGCVTTPTWLDPTIAHVSLFNVPDGPAWASVLRLVHNNMDSFSTTDHPLLLGFIEDWARGISWQNPYPDGAESVAAIAHTLLPAFDDYNSKDEEQRTLRVIAKIPKADSSKFAALLQGRRDGERRDHQTVDFQEMVFEELEGGPVARDLPELVVAVAKNYLLCSEADLCREQRYGVSSEVEVLFGIRYERSHGFFPTSAYRGPFLALLRNHPDKGLAFVIAALNHSADWYGRPRVESEYVESPVEVTLNFPDGTSRTQWCNARLWNLYRGTSVGPCALQSLLMALEYWLLELAEAIPRELDTVLLSILRQSNSAALTAVVASAATAFPHHAGGTLLVLLSSRWCILFDRNRLVNEAQSTSKLFGLMSQWDTRNKVYEDERKKSDALPHRQHDLGTAITNLQLGVYVQQVHEILDRHRASMPPVEEQNEEDRIWRLAIHRMDLRQYAISKQQPEDPIAVDDGDVKTASRQEIRLDLKPPEPDVKEMVDRNTAEYQTINTGLGLLMWGMKVFGREEGTAYDPAKWRERLAEARAAGDIESIEPWSGRGGTGHVAAVCVRDHWEEMTNDEQNWCVNIVCSEVERAADHWNRMARVQRFNMSADRPCAQIVSILLGKQLSEAQRFLVQKTLIIALTHAIDEVRWFAAWGIGKNLWVINRGLTIRCVNALAMEARLVQEAADEQRGKHLSEREVSEYHNGGWVDRIESTVASGIRERFFVENGIPDDALQTYDPTRWFGAEANGRILVILGQAPTEQAAIEAFGRVGHTLVSWWDADDDRRRSRDRSHNQERNYQIEASLLESLENFVLRTTSDGAATIIRPIVDAIDRYPEKVHRFLLGLIGIEDRQPNTPQFWSLWKLFAEKVRRATWLGRIDSEHPVGREMVSALFLGTKWKDEVRHWRSLEGHSEHVHKLFDELPACSRVLDDYVRFLHHIGEQSLPQAFIRVMNRLQQGDHRQMLRLRNTVFLLELLLQRYVYGRPLELKRQDDLRNAVLGLLDLMVENGSSAAFRMRDDFVTPLPIA